jgi:hypothetical protein
MTELAVVVVADNQERRGEICELSTGANHKHLPSRAKPADPATGLVATAYSDTIQRSQPDFPFL